MNTSQIKGSASCKLRMDPPRLCQDISDTSTFANKVVHLSTDTGAGLQEHDLKGVHDEAPERDIAVYLGLAATAFLLVMLHPSKEDETPSSPAAVQPIQLEGVQVCAHILTACLGTKSPFKRSGADACESPYECDYPHIWALHVNAWQGPACAPLLEGCKGVCCRKCHASANEQMTGESCWTKLAGDCCTGGVCQGIGPAARPRLSSASAHGGREHGR